ncbi:protein HAPLESS 2 [Tanacetum coccineum]
MKPLIILMISIILTNHIVNGGVQVISKSKLQKCQKDNLNAPLNCSQKIVVDIAVPSESSGAEASIVAQLDEVEESSSDNMKTLRDPPEITINKSAAYAEYHLTYIRDVAYRPEEFFHQTRKCDSNAGANIVGVECEKLRDGNGNVIEHTQEVVIGPQNRAAASADSFLRVSLIGEYFGYTDIPSFEDFFLVIPRQGGPGQPKYLGTDYSKWMLLERVRFSLDGMECDKIGVSYQAFNGQPNFCSSPRYSCLHNQLWNFWEADQNRIQRNQVPLYGLQGRFERINQHPNAGIQSFSIGIPEGLTSNLLVELSADDIEFVYQRSPGRIVSITVPTFQALTQYGTATITSTNTGEVEASYSLTFDCSVGINIMEEQFFIMKPKESVTRYYRLFPENDQAAKYVCHAILKDSDFHEIDRAECQFTTTATVLDNGTQTAFEPGKDGGIKGFFESIEEWWHAFWEVILLVWLLHENGLFDPIYDWWEDHFWDEGQKIRQMRKHHHGLDAYHHNKHHKKKPKHHHTDGHHKRQRVMDQEHRHTHTDKHKHGRIKGSSNTHPLYGDGTSRAVIKHGHATSDDIRHKHLHSKRRG